MLTLQLLILNKEQWENIEKGDIKAYSEAYIFYYKKLYNYGRKFTEDTGMTGDAINEVFITLWNQRKNLAAIDFPQAYLFTSFRNNILKKIKRSKVISSIEATAEEEVAFSAETLIIKKETDKAQQRKLKEAFKQLTARQKEAIFLRFYEGLSYKEIATTMNISVKATYKIMARALLQLKDILSLHLMLFLTLLREL